MSVPRKTASSSASFRTSILQALFFLTDPCLAYRSDGVPWMLREFEKKKHGGPAKADVDTDTGQWLEVTVNAVNSHIVRTRQLPKVQSATLTCA